MTILENTLESVIETDTWDDPGDYPSGAGGGPLPDYTYQFASDVTGTLVVLVTDKELQDWKGEPSGPEDFLEYIQESDELVKSLPYGVNKVKRWRLDSIQTDPGTYTATLSVFEFESEEMEYDGQSDYEPDYDIPEYDPDEDI